MTPQRAGFTEPHPGAGWGREARGLSTYNPSSTCWLHTEPAYRHPLYHAYV